MNHKFKMRQRVTALCMAAMMCCGMLPYGALAEDSCKTGCGRNAGTGGNAGSKTESDANSTATPETAMNHWTRMPHNRNLKPRATLAAVTNVRNLA